MVTEIDTIDESKKCSSCGGILETWLGTNGHLQQGYSIRREWKKRGWVFCEKCVISLKVRKWVEERVKNGKS